MSLIDGRYEVIAERPLSGGRTHFDATAPDGAPLRIEWFDLPPEQEAEFERYRRLLKRLKQAGKAAVHDVVSRPGARYVAWRSPPEGAAAALDPELSELLAAHGYPPEAADVRRAGGRGAPPLLYGLAFGGASLPSPAPAGAADEPARPLRHVDRPPLAALERLSPTTFGWGVAALVALLAVVIGVTSFRLRNVDQLVVVPDLVGQPAQAAADALADLELWVVPAALASSEAPGTVLALDPPAGSELRPGRTVRLSYALPPGRLAPTEVPDLVGQAFPAGAEPALQAAGLRVGEVARVHAAAPPGTVLAQGADPRSRLGSGEAVDLLVSLGPLPQRTFLPRLVKLNVKKTHELALLAGLAPDRVLVDEVAAATGSPGQVLGQSLAPFVPVPVEDAVLRLVVQAGTPVGARGGAPDVVGLPLAAAQRVAGGWDVTVERIANSALPEGVVAQTPPPGAAGEGNALTLVVNAHPVPLTTEGVRAVVREPEPRRVAYAWTILPGIATQPAEVWATDIDGQRTLVERVTVRGGEILRGSWLTDSPGPVRFELFLAGVPYGEPLLVP